MGSRVEAFERAQPLKSGRFEQAPAIAMATAVPGDAYGAAYPHRPANVEVPTEERGAYALALVAGTHAVHVEDAVAAAERDVDIERRKAEVVAGVTGAGHVEQAKAKDCRWIG